MKPGEIKITNIILKFSYFCIKNTTQRMAKAAKY